MCLCAHKLIFDVTEQHMSAGGILREDTDVITDVAKLHRTVHRASLCRRDSSQGQK